jgi:hypothetical protein
VTAADGGLEQLPDSVELAVITSPTTKAVNPVIVQSVTLTVAAPKSVTPLYTSTLAPVTQVPLIEVAPAHKGEVTTGAAATFCTVCGVEVALTHLPVAEAEASTELPVTKGATDIVHAPELTVVVPTKPASIYTVIVVPSASLLVPLTVVAEVHSVVTTGTDVAFSTVTEEEARLIHLPDSVALAVITSPPDRADSPVIDQLVPITVAAPKTVPPSNTSTVAPNTQVPIIEVAAAQIGEVTEGAVETLCTITAEEAVLTHLPEAVAVAVMLLVAAKAETVAVHVPELTVVVPAELPST